MKCTFNADDCGPFCGLVQMTPDKPCIRSQLHSPLNSGIPMQATSKSDSRVKFNDQFSNGRYWSFIFRIISCTRWPASASTQLGRIRLPAALLNMSLLGTSRPRGARSPWISMRPPKRPKNCRSHLHSVSKHLESAGATAELHSSADRSLGLESSLASQIADHHYFLPPFIDLFGTSDLL